MQCQFEMCFEDAMQNFQKLKENIFLELVKTLSTDMNIHHQIRKC